MLTKKITAEDITAILPDILQENLPLYHIMKVITKYNDQVASRNGEGIVEDTICTRSMLKIYSVEVNQ